MQGHAVKALRSLSSSAPVAIGCLQWRIAGDGLAYTKEDFFKFYATKFWHVDDTVPGSATQMQERAFRNSRCCHQAVLQSVLHFKIAGTIRWCAARIQFPFDGVSWETVQVFQASCPLQPTYLHSVEHSKLQSDDFQSYLRELSRRRRAHRNTSDKCRPKLQGDLSEQK